MSTSWMAYVLLIGTIVATAVVALDAACRLAGWPRRWAPFGGLLLIIALAVIAPESAPERPSVNGPAIQLADFNIPITETTELDPATPAREVVSLAGTMQRIRSGVEALPQLVERALPRRFQSFYSVAWAASSAILLLLFVLVHLRFLRARRGWPVLNLFGTNVRLSPTAGPAVVGAFRPDIVIPKWLLQREREQQLLVLEHEREHVRTRDPLMLASAWTCALALPWHPAVWWMLWRLRLAVELDCDARVLAHGTPRRSYGALLIDLSQQSSGLPVGATALSDRTTHLERRLLAMNTHRPSFFRLRSIAFALIATVMVLSACALRKPAKADRPGEATIGEVDFRGPGETTFEVDFQRATADIVTRLEQFVTIDGEVQPLPVKSFVREESAAFVQPERDYSRLLQIIDGEIQKQLPTVPPQDTSKRTPPVPARPMIIIDGVIQMSQGAPPQDTSKKTPPPAPARFTTPLIIIDGVIQMRDDPTVGQRAVPPTRVDTVRTAPPSPPVRPRVDTLPAVTRQQLGHLLVIVDGVIIISDTASILRNLTGDQIASVEVIQGAAAASLYGERARNGVLNIRTKAYQATTSPLGGRGGGGAGAGGRVAGLQVRGGAQPGSDVVIQIRNPLSISGTSGQPLIIVDGVIQTDSTGAALNIDPSKIESIEVVRGAAAVALYGDRAANGVINIKLKKR